MTPRNRYLECVLFGAPDKIPFSPGGPRESTLSRWRSEGLPADRPWFDVLLETLGVEKQSDGSSPEALDVSFKMMPQFEEEVLEHKNGHYLVRDWMGAVTEISDVYDYTYIRAAKDFVTRKWHKFPVQTRADWEEMKKRYDPKTEGRHPEDLMERCARMKDRDTVAGIHFNGPFWQLREWCGFEGLCLLMLDDPPWVEEMCDFWCDFVLETMRPILENVTLDSVGMSEDMAYKEHSMISPAMVRQFLMPCYAKWISASKDSGVPVIFMDSDGHIGDLLPLWIEAGINCCGPIEVAAGNDVVEYRRRFGKKMAYTGTVDKRAIAKGGKIMEQEVLRVVLPLLEDGGTIPGCDHGVPHDISWSNFIEYARLLARLTGWL